MFFRTAHALTLAGLLAAPSIMSASLDSKSSSDVFYFPTTGVTVKKQVMLLGIDDYMLPIKENLGTYMSTPTYRKDPVVSPSKDYPAAPDQVASHFYGAVIESDGNYQMWYY